MRRSPHLAIQVPASRLEEAVAHYRTLFDVQVGTRQDPGARLEGPNFTLWLDVAEEPASVMQEFVAADRETARAKHRAAGCRIFDEGEDGFHVEDPYGLSYHVWIDESGEKPPG